MPSSNDKQRIIEAQQRAQRRAAAHALRTKTAPSISGKMPRRNRRKIKARLPWDDSVAGKSLPRSVAAATATAAAAATTATTTTTTAASRIAPLLITDRADGSPVNTRTVYSIICKRPVTGGRSESLAKSSVATSPIDTTRLREVIEPATLTPLSDREADALEKLEEKLTELETIEDMIRLQIGDGESVFGEDFGEEEDSGIDKEQCAKSSDHILVDTAAAFLSSQIDDNEDGGNDDASSYKIPAPLNISLNESVEARLIESSQVYQCRRRRIIEGPFERTGLPAHAVIEEAVEAIIDDEIQRLRLEELDRVDCA